MNYFLLKNFLSSYSLPTLLIALCVAFGCYLLEKLIKKQISGMIKAQLPFIIAILVYFAYDMIFVSKAFVFKDDALYAGILSGSLAKMPLKSIHETIKELRYAAGRIIPIAAMITSGVSGSSRTSRRSG